VGIGLLATAAVIALGRMGVPCATNAVPGNSGAVMQSVDYFTRTYSDARTRFLEAAEAAGGSVTSLENPHQGPDGERLFTDVAVFGPRDATSILVVSSGTHGVEGFAGSGVQSGLLQEGIAGRLPNGVQLVMIHGINPYGMAHGRRVNEDNVDLNRNFLDHATPPPVNPGYEHLADVIAPTSMAFWREVGAFSRFVWYVARNGKTGLTKAVSGAQYTHPDGLFYGGRFPTWSNTTVRAIAERWLSHADRVVIVDVHTGLGEYGSAEIILNSPEDSPAYGRAVAMWGAEQVRSTVSGGSVSIHLGATLKLAFPEMLPNSEVTAVSLEYGTVPILEVAKALRAENWLHHYGGNAHLKAGDIKECLLRAFHPDTDDWEAIVWEEGKSVVGRALEWMSG
jgi:hypothetical protein